jgi:hypothetical protein
MHLAVPYATTKHDIGKAPLNLSFTPTPFVAALNKIANFELITNLLNIRHISAHLKI